MSIVYWIIGPEITFHNIKQSLTFYAFVVIVSVPNAWIPTKKPKTPSTINFKHRKAIVNGKKVVRQIYTIIIIIIMFFWITIRWNRCVNCVCVCVCWTCVPFGEPQIIHLYLLDEIQMQTNRTLLCVCVYMPHTFTDQLFEWTNIDTIGFRTHPSYIYIRVAFNLVPDQNEWKVPVSICEDWHLMTVSDTLKSLCGKHSGIIACHCRIVIVYYDVSWY